MPLTIAAGGCSPSSSAESSFRELDDVFLQTQTRIWIGEVLEARLDEQLNVSDLLADGELLLEVSKVLWNMVMTSSLEMRKNKIYKYKPVTLRSSGRYTPYSNVDSFLKICKILGLASIDLFSPSDVVERKDTRRVCMCIRSLSKKARSQQLNVPDFDVVTYTIAMPTDMVGWIRRSLELSQCSSLTSASNDGCRDMRVKGKQNKFVAASSRNRDLNFEDSGECNYLTVRYYSQCPKYSDDCAAVMNPDFQISPGVSSEIKEFSFTESSRLDTCDSDNEEYAHYAENEDGYAQKAEYNKLADIPSPLSFDSEMLLNDRFLHIYGRLKHENENVELEFLDGNHDLGDGACDVGDSICYSTASSSCSAVQTPISNPVRGRTASCDTFIFDDKDSILYMGSESGGSNSTHGSEVSPNDIEDVEILSTASVCSVSCRAQYWNFEGDYNLGNNAETAEGPYAERQSDKAAFAGKGIKKINKAHDMVAHESLIHRVIHDTKKPQFEIGTDDGGLSSTCFLSCLDWPSPGCVSTDLACNSAVCSNSTGSNNDIKINGNDTSGKLVIGEDLRETLLHYVPHNASLEVWLKNVDSVITGNDEDVFSEYMLESDSEIKLRRNSCLWGDCSNDILEATYKNHDDSLINVAAEESEERHKLEESLKLKIGIEDAGLSSVRKNAYGKDQWLQNVESLTAADKEFSDPRLESDHVIRGLPINCPQEECSSEIVEVAGKNYHVLVNNVTAEESKASHDSSNRCHTCHDLKITIPVNNNLAVSDLVTPVNPSSATKKKCPSPTVDKSEDVGHHCLLACKEPERDLHNAPDVDIMRHQKHERLESSVADVSNGGKDTSAGALHRSGHKKTLLKYVMSGTAIFGIFFLFDQFRKRNYVMGTEDSKNKPVQPRKTMSSSEKRQKGDKVNGVYPAEKLKLRD